MRICRFATNLSALVRRDPPARAAAMETSLRCVMCGTSEFHVCLTHRKACNVGSARATEVPYSRRVARRISVEM